MLTMLTDDPAAWWEYHLLLLVVGPPFLGGIFFIGWLEKRKKISRRFSLWLMLLWLLALTAPTSFMEAHCVWPYSCRAFRPYP